MSRQVNQQLVFLDLETTGLHPQRDAILEIGIALVHPVGMTTHSTFRSLVEPPWGSRVVGMPKPAREAIIRQHLDGVVFDMHTKSGLLQELAESAGDGRLRYVEAVERAFCTYLSDAGIEYGAATIAGFCPQFDMGFLKVHMPVLAGWFDYRMLDVSSYRSAMRRWVGPEIDAYFKRLHPETKHRVIADCHEAIDELCFYKRFIDLDGMRKDIAPPVEAVPPTAEPAMEAAK